MQEMDFSITDYFFHISPKGAESPAYELPAAQLLDPGKAEEALRELGKLYKATGLELPVSYIGLTFFNLCLTRILFLAQYRRILDLSLDNLTFQLETHDDHVHVGYRIDKVNWTELAADPEQARQQTIEAWAELFRDTVNAGVESVTKAAGFKPAMIWNQFGAQIHSIRQYVHETMGAQQPQLPALFDHEFYIVESLSPDVFGRNRNPFVHTPKYIDNPWSPPDGKYIMRSACCMYDRRENGQKCYNCPNMKPEEREERRQLVLSQQEH